MLCHFCRNCGCGREVGLWDKVNLQTCICRYRMSSSFLPLDLNIFETIAAFAAKNISYTLCSYSQWRQNSFCSDFFTFVFGWPTNFCVELTACIYNLPVTLGICCWHHRCIIWPAAPTQAPSEVTFFYVEYSYLSVVHVILESMQYRYCTCCCNSW